MRMELNLILLKVKYAKVCSWLINNNLGCDPSCETCLSEGMYGCVICAANSKLNAETKKCDCNDGFMKSRMNTCIA
jgi:hypothetical protein